MLGDPYRRAADALDLPHEVSGRAGQLTALVQVRWPPTEGARPRHAQREVLDNISHLAGYLRDLATELEYIATDAQSQHFGFRLGSDEARRPESSRHEGLPRGRTDTDGTDPSL